MYAQVSVPKQEENKERRKEVTELSLHTGIVNMFCVSHHPGNAEKQNL